MQPQFLALVLVALVPQAPALPEPALALKGLDPVALCEGEEVPGDPGLTLSLDRFTYRFVSEESRATFRADPGRWGIQWGGACGRMGPLSGRGSPDRWAVVDGRIFVFASDGCRAGFLADAEAFLAEPPGPRAGDAAAGRAALERVLAAHGGAEALERAAAVRFTATHESQGWTNALELVVTSEGATRRRSAWTPPEEGAEGIETVWSGDAADAFTVEDGVTYRLGSADERGDLLRHAHRQLVPLLWAARRGALEAVLVADGEVDVRLDGLTTTLLLAPDGGITGLRWTGRLEDGVTRTIEETLGDWATVGGLRLATTRTVRKGDGEPASDPRWAVEVLDEVPGE